MELGGESFGSLSDCDVIAGGHSGAGGISSDGFEVRVGVEVEVGVEFRLRAWISFIPG